MSYLRLVPTGNGVAVAPRAALLGYMVRYEAHPNYVEYRAFMAQWPDDLFPSDIFPLGYRFLDEGERAQAGDLVLAYAPGDQWKIRPYDLYMDGFLDGNDCRVFRKLKGGER